ncbi:MAG: prenyltransferase/squalene oxidase repeat-containing protein [Phycisphaerales bacterium JB040]
MRLKTIPAFLACSLVTLTCAAQPIEAELRAKARESADRAIAYLRSQQDPVSGGWSVREPGRQLPAISSLVLTGMIMDPRLDASDETIRRGVDFVLSFRAPDGGIHDGFLPNYNTSISVSMLSRLGTPEAARAIQTAVPYLKTLQYDESYEGSLESPGFTEPVSRDHPYYGGVGYGNNSRPDLSNLGFFLDALHDAGVSTEDPAYRKALVFLSRVQMLDEVNDQPYADDSEQGGFVYATTPNADSVDEFIGQSQAGYYEEQTSDGRTLTRLRAYGSATYLGFKSLIYADLSADDPRLVAAREWIERNFTLDENPGLGDQGRYYYYCAMARALGAWGDDAIGPEGSERDWREGLVRALLALQNEDGSFRVLHERWMEGDEVLITAYALIALQTAANDR